MTEYPPTYCPNCGNELDANDAPRYRCDACPRNVYHAPTPAAGVVVIDQPREHALLIERGVPPAKGRWTLPGGHPELGEGPAEGAARELGEETGITADPDDLSLVSASDLTPHVDREGDADRKAVIRTTYAVAYADTVGVPGDGGNGIDVPGAGDDAVDAPEAGDDAVDVRWVDRGDLDAVAWAFAEDRSAVTTAFDTL